MRKHVVQSFLKKYNVRMRARQRCRKTAKQNFEPDLKKWHATTRKKLVRTGRNDGYDGKWGRYQSKQRLNVDQSPLPFVVGTSRTYDHLDKNVDQSMTTKSGSVSLEVVWTSASAHFRSVSDQLVSNPGLVLSSVELENV